MEFDAIDIDLNNLSLDDFDLSALNFDIPDFGLFDTDGEKGKTETRYIEPKSTNKKLEQNSYKYAQNLADSIDLSKRTFAILDGNFIFGDLLEALIVNGKIKPKRIDIGTLSLSRDNVTSLKKIMLRCDSLKNINIVTSNYFYSHEKDNIIKYMYQELDFDNRYQLAIAHIHCKMILIETTNGKKIIMHGSANMRSNGNYEQVDIEQNAELYDFNINFLQTILDKNATIKNGIEHTVKKGSVPRGQYKKRRPMQPF